MAGPSHRNKPSLNPYRLMSFTRNAARLITLFTLFTPLAWAQPTEKEGFIDVPGGKVWYKIMGVGKPGIPLLTLHGGPGSTSAGFAGFAALADERPVIIYDQLGCGKSDRPDDTSLWTLGRFVDELDQVVKTLGYPKLHLLGHSWGTTLATEYLLTKKPANIVSVIESSPCLDATRWTNDATRYIAQLPPATQRAIRLDKATDSIGQKAYQDALNVYYSLHVWRNKPANVPPNTGFGKVVYETMWGPDETIAMGNLKGYTCVDRLKNLTLPVLYLCGQYDEASPESTRYFQQHTGTKRSPKARLVVFPNASHATYREVPDLYFKTVRAFLHEF